MSIYSAFLEKIKPTLRHISIVIFLSCIPAIYIYTEARNLNNEKIEFANEKSEFEKYKYEKNNILNEREFNLKFRELELSKMKSTIEKQTLEIENLNRTLEEEKGNSAVRDGLNSL